MSPMSFSNGSCILSLDSLKAPSFPGVSKKSLKAVPLTHQLTVVDELAAIIDNTVKELVNDVLNQIANFFTTDDRVIQRENIFSQRYTIRKLKAGIVQCNVSDVGHLINGLLDRLQGTVCDPIVLKSGDMDIRGVVNRIRDCNGNRKPLVVVEQSESCNASLLNGLIYSLASIRSDTLILLCLSTKKTMLTSIVSRKCLSLLHARSFSFFTPEEVFDLLVPAVMINPQCTDLRFNPEFLIFLRSSFFRDNFSVSHMKKCLRFAFFRHHFTRSISDPRQETSDAFVREMDTYMGALNFLHTNLYSFSSSCGAVVRGALRRTRGRWFDLALMAHQAVHPSGVGEISYSRFIKLLKVVIPNMFNPYKPVRSIRTRNWIQSLKNMSHEEFSAVLLHPGIAVHNISLPPNIQNKDTETLVKLPEDKMTAIALKERMKEIIAAKQRNPYVKARQKAILDIENVLRSVLRPFSSFSNSSQFLVGEECIHSLAPNIVKDIEASLAMESASPLSIALHALLKQGRWKIVDLSKWGETFSVDASEQSLKATEDQIESMFFACVGQLEHMGIIKASKERETLSVVIAHHVLGQTVSCN
ncbi:hypothetical protein KIN20_003953 [Parelaphostrongylus tenuis]|uniref:Origin recognition complex subunit 3 N-terminal domain-containing protein n=1 Tax=Parelaphostrongylus tenuis TaxID=148309 RepID=A0AAD5QHQ0_PARTN|nr:hypothetical protein KIN20_003953 [Parelaphostrongylus tenuis]